MYVLISEVVSSMTFLASRTFSRTHFEVLGLGGQVLGVSLKVLENALYSVKDGTTYLIC